MVLDDRLRPGAFVFLNFRGVLVDMCRRTMLIERNVSDLPFWTTTRCRGYVWMLFWPLVRADRPRRDTMSYRGVGELKTGLGCGSVRGVRRVSVLGVVVGLMFVSQTSGADAAPVFTQVGTPTATGLYPYSVVFSPDGGLLATVNPGGNSVSMFSVSAAGQLTPAGPATAAGSRPYSLAFSPGGELLATASSGDNSLSMFSVSVGGQLMQVGSPTATGNYPDTVAFSPRGGLLASANDYGNSVSVFSVSAGGQLTQVGSPTATGSYPYSIAFSPDGGLLAVANIGDSTVSVFSVSAGGQLTQVGSPTATGSAPISIAFSPDGGLLATANVGANTVSEFSVSAGGQLTQVGSPTATGSTPTSVAFSPDGGLLVTANSGDNTVSVFSVRTGGQLTQVGSPIATGSGPQSVAFSPDAGLLAVANESDSTVSVFAGGDPIAQITAPTDQHTYAQNQIVTTNFGCTTPTGSGAIISCTDSNGATSPSGTLNTSTLGAHTYTVTATSNDTLASSTTVRYSVAAAPPTTTSPATTTTPSTTGPATTTTRPVASPPNAQASIGGISLTSHTITWCRSCKYPSAELLFTLSQPATVRLVLTAKTRRAWRQVASTLLRPHATANRYRLAGRWHGQLVPARHLRLLVQLAHGGHWRTRTTMTLTVHSPFTTINHPQT
jgi:DNA-binding beta-propeller fold protein YncE